MNIDDLPEDSDSSDEDYVPGAKPEEQVSEVESDGDPEDPLSDTENGTPSSKGKKRKKQTKSARKRNKTSENRIEDVNRQKENEDNKEEETEEEKKKRADSLWASFKKDTGFKPKNLKPSVQSVSNNLKTQPLPNRTQEKIKVTKVFEFAGEEVKVEKEVPIDSAEARLAQIASGSDTTQKTSRGRAAKSLGGIGSVLSQLGKKPKISTLEKSKLDWDRFKKEENIEEELATYNKGKDGYLERQDFLQRADLRRFEIEKEIRTIERNKRVDNVL